MGTRTWGLQGTHHVRVLAAGLAQRLAAAAAPACTSGCSEPLRILPAGTFGPRGRARAPASRDCPTQQGPQALVAPPADCLRFPRVQGVCAGAAAEVCAHPAGRLPAVDSRAHRQLCAGAQPPGAPPPPPFVGRPKRRWARLHVLAVFLTLLCVGRCAAVCGGPTCALCSLCLAC